MNLYCKHFNKPITHDLTKWIACSIRSMCAGCWELIDEDEEDIYECDAIYSECFYGFSSPMMINIDCEYLKSNDRCIYDDKCEFKRERK